MSELLTIYRLVDDTYWAYFSFTIFSIVFISLTWHYFIVISLEFTSHSITQSITHHDKDHTDPALSSQAPKQSFYSYWTPKPVQYLKPTDQAQQ